MKKLILSFVFMLASAWILADSGQRNAIVVPVLPQALQVIDNNDCGCESSDEKSQAVYCSVSIPLLSGNTYEASCWFCDCNQLAISSAQAAAEINKSILGN